MLSHWIFFVSLLLLPYSTLGFNITDDDGDDCPEPVTEGNRTLHCFKLQMRDAILPPDNRLIPNRIVFHRKEEGVITEYYVSEDIAPWMRKKIKKQNEEGKSLNKIRFFINLPASEQFVDADYFSHTNFNEFYLYFGSDHAQMYLAPRHGYNPEFLQLKREENTQCSQKLYYEIGEIVNKNGKVVVSNYGSLVEPRGRTISTPGIYVMKKGSPQVNEVTYDPLTKYNVLNYHGDYCHQPITGIFQENNVTMTTYCFKLRFKKIHPRDNRLLPTAIAFLVVDDNGKMFERYINRDISSWVREKTEMQRELDYGFNYFTFQMQFPGDIEESQLIVKRITDAILYFGSDHAQIYDRPNVGFDPENLQLSEQPTDDLSRDVEYSIEYIHDWKEYPWMYLSYPVPTISKPGIYRIIKTAVTLKELKIDPMYTDIAYINRK